MLSAYFVCGMQEMRSFRLADVCTHAGRSLLNAVLPPLCLGCGEIVAEPGRLCPTCWTGFDFVTPPLCACCGVPFADDPGPATLCAVCLLRRPRFRRARAALVYDDMTRKLVLPFKHGDRTDIARAFGGWMARAGLDLVNDADLVVPVPLHWRRLLVRRYNQAALLARGVVREAVAMGARPPRFVPDLLTRRRSTPTQAGLGARERRRNVREAFEVPARRRPLVDGRTVLLVDDVFTTGATVEACARALQRNGARHVDVLTLARVVRTAV